MPRRSRARVLAVWVNGRHAADWKIPARGDVELQYQRAWVESEEGRPLSLSLPFTLDNLPIKGDAVRHYFDNLLPDSEAIRQRIQSRYRTPSRDPFDLLFAIGRDCVGAVQLLAPDEAPGDLRTIAAEPLGDKEIEAALMQTTAPSFPAGMGPDDFRVSLAGAQEKWAFLRHAGQWCRPLGTTPTTHIFKLPLGLVAGIAADMTTSVENEWLCSRILEHYGVPAAKCEMGQFGSQKVLIVQRFDRILHRSGAYWLRLVQEDFCQTLAVPSSLKYERDGGPGILEIAAILRGSANRDADLECLLKAQILFWMLAAGDGHAKNFSLRILSQGRYQLTPLYDVLSYWPIIGESPNKIPLKSVRLAMSLRGKNKHYLLTEIQRRHFNETAARSGVGRSAEPLIEEILAKTPHVIATVQKEIPQGFPQNVLEPILNGLMESANKLERMLP